jgi:acyl-CoA reductase-like NAD-dependent aldehyde dehydrogenase
VLPIDSEDSVDQKVRDASRAMRSWSGASPMHRADVLLRIARETRLRFDELVPALAKEQGKTLKEAALELERYVGPSSSTQVSPRALVAATSLSVEVSRDISNTFR